MGFKARKKPVSFEVLATRDDSGQVDLWKGSARPYDDDGEWNCMERGSMAAPAVCFHYRSLLNLDDIPTDRPTRYRVTFERLD